MMPTSFGTYYKTANDWFDSLTSVAAAANDASTSFKGLTQATDSWKVLYHQAVQNYNWGKHYYATTGDFDDTCDWNATPVTTPMPVGKPIVHTAVEAPSLKRKSAPREFNKYINASDLLEEFIRYCGEQGVRQREMLELPVDLFIKWLIIRACEEDKEEPNVTLELPAPKRQCRCLGCGQFMQRGLALPIHNSRCYNFYFVRSQNGGDTCPARLTPAPVATN